MAEIDVDFDDIDFDKVGLLAVPTERSCCAGRNIPPRCSYTGRLREPGESAMDCLSRELREELGDVVASAIERLECTRIERRAPKQHRPKRFGSSFTRRN